MNLRSCPYNRDFGGNAGILIFHSFIFTISLFFWILPSCALLCGIKRNQCGLFVPWILSMGFQSPMLAWALVEHFNEILKYYRTIEISLVVALLPILALIIMQIIVWRACLRIKRNRSRNTNRSNQEVIPSEGMLGTEEDGDYHHVLRAFCIFITSIIFIFCILLWALIYGGKSH